MVVLPTQFESAGTRVVWPTMFSPLKFMEGALRKRQLGEHIP